MLACVLTDVDEDRALCGRRWRRRPDASGELQQEANDGRLFADGSLLAAVGKEFLNAVAQLCGARRIEEGHLELDAVELLDEVVVRGGRGG